MNNQPHRPPSTSAKAKFATTVTAALIVAFLIYALVTLAPLMNAPQQ